MKWDHSSSSFALRDVRMNCDEGCKEVLITDSQAPPHGTRSRQRVVAIAKARACCPFSNHVNNSFVLSPSNKQLQPREVSKLAQASEAGKWQRDKKHNLQGLVLFFFSLTNI